MGQLRSSVTLTRMMMYGVDLYRRLAAETGVDPSWHEVGSLRLASTPARLEELRRQAGWAKTFGLPLELITADGGPGPLPADDAPTASSARSGCRPTAGWTRRTSRSRWRPVRGSAGVRILHAHRVSWHRRPGRAASRAWSVEHGGERITIAADVVVNAGGMYAPEIGRLAGVNVPAHPDGPPVPAHRGGSRASTPGLPQLRDPDNLVYFREEVGGLCMGGYERDPAPWALDGIPADFNHRLLDPDWPRFEPIMDGRDPAGPGHRRRAASPG